MLPPLQFPHVPSVFSASRTHLLPAKKSSFYAICLYFIHGVTSFHEHTWLRKDWTLSSELHSCSIITCFIDYLKQFFFKFCVGFPMPHKSFFSWLHLSPVPLCWREQLNFSSSDNICCAEYFLSLSFSKRLHKTGTYYIILKLQIRKLRLSEVK